MAPRALAALAVGAALAVPAQASAGPRLQPSPPAPSDAQIEAARQYLLFSGASAAFAFADESGRVRGFRTARVYRAGSLTKVMLLLAYLDRPGLRDAPLSLEQRRLLGPMIRASANEPAEVVYRIVGDGGLRRVARRAGMRGFHSDHARDGFQWGWGAAETTARDQARLMLRVVELAPVRHRAYVRGLLTTIAADQRWGIPQAAGSRWTVLFKGASGAPGPTGGGVNQVARLEGRRGAAALAVLVEDAPTYEHAQDTIRRIGEIVLGPR